MSISSKAAYIRVFKGIVTTSRHPKNVTVIVSRPSLVFPNGGGTTFDRRKIAGADMGGGEGPAENDYLLR